MERKEKKFRYIEQIGKGSKCFKIRFLWRCPYDLSFAENTVGIELERVIKVWSNTLANARKLLEKEFPTTCIAVWIECE